MPNRYRLKGASLEEIRRKAEQLYGPAARIVSAERVSSPGIAGLFAQDRYEAMIELQSKHEVVTGEVVPDADILAGADSGPATGGPAGETAAGAATAGTVPGTVPGAGTPAGKYDAGAAAAAPAPPAARTAAQAGPAGGPARPAAPTHHLQGAAIAALLEEADAAELSLHRPAPAGVSTESRDFAELLEQLGTGLRTPTDPPAAAPAAAVGSPAHPPPPSGAPRTRPPSGAPRTRPPSRRATLRVPRLRLR